MTQLAQTTGVFRISHPRITYTPQQRGFGMAFAIAMEAGIVYAMLVTLGYVEAPLARPPLTIVNVASLPDEREVPPPPPQTFEPPQVAPVVPLVELAFVPPTPPTAISLPPPPPVAPLDATPPPPPVILTPPRAIEATHTIPEYPPVSQRLREQGTLRLRLAIDEKGVVTAATVVNPSGFRRLDEAAVKWIKTHWRYAPARRGAMAVSATAEAIVEFRLQ